MGLLDIFKKKNKNPEAERRRVLLERGRITEGTILEGDSPDSATIYYVYVVSGADYESSQTLDEQQQADPKKYAPGAKVSIRYDPRQPANSLVV